MREALHSWETRKHWSGRSLEHYVGISISVPTVKAEIVEELTPVMEETASDEHVGC